MPLTTREALEIFRAANPHSLCNTYAAYKVAADNPHLLLSEEPYDRDVLFPLLFDAMHEWHEAQRNPS